MGISRLDEMEEVMETTPETRQNTPKFLFFEKSKKNILLKKFIIYNLNFIFFQAETGWRGKLTDRER